MNRPRFGAARATALLVALCVSLPVHSGGAKTRSSAHSGHRVAHHGVASFYRQSRNLPNGVSIFNQSAPATHLQGGKPERRMHGERHGMRESAHTNRNAIDTRRHGRPPAESVHRGHGDSRKKGHEHPQQAKHDKRKRKSHEKAPIVYGSTVYVLSSEPELYVPEESSADDCRSLTERGYDLSGRRVLVEWTLCFDDRGEAYVPEDGRRIVARF